MLWDYLHSVLKNTTLTSYNRCTVPKNAISQHHCSTHLHCTLKTYPDISILVIWFPVSPCITIEHPILSDPVRTAIPALSCNSSDLLPIPKIHLQPLIMITVWWRPTSCTCWVETEKRCRPQTLALKWTHSEDVDCWKTAQLRGV